MTTTTDSGTVTLADFDTFTRAIQDADVLYMDQTDNGDVKATALQLKTYVQAGLVLYNPAALSVPSRPLIDTDDILGVEADNGNVKMTALQVKTYVLNGLTNYNPATLAASSTAIGDTDVLLAIQGSTNTKVTAAQLKTYIGASASGYNPATLTVVTRALTDADDFLLTQSDNGNVKVAASTIKTYMQSGLSAYTPSALTASSTAVADADFILAIQGANNTKVTAAQLKTYMGVSGFLSPGALVTTTRAIADSDYVFGNQADNGNIRYTALQFKTYIAAASNSGVITVLVAAPSSIPETRVDGQLDASFLMGNYPVVDPTNYADFGRAASIGLTGVMTRATVANYLASSGYIAAAAINKARYSYTHTAKGATLHGVLTEPLSANMMYNSRPLISPGVIGAATLVASTNGVLSMDGATPAYCLTEGTSTVSHTVRLSMVTLGVLGNYTTASLYVRPNGRYQCTLRGSFLTGASGASAQASVNYDCQAMTASASADGSVGFITALPNGWYRLELCVPALTASDTTANTGGVLFYMKNQNATSGDGLSYAGDGVSGFYIDYLQVEAAPRATSPMPSTATVLGSRTALDLVTYDATSYLTAQAGSLVLDGIVPSRLNGVGSVLATLWDGTTANAFTVTLSPAQGGTGTNKANAQIIVTSTKASTVGVTAKTDFLLVPGAAYRLAISYAASGILISLNGAAALTNTGTMALPTTCNSLALGTAPTQAIVISRLARYDYAMTQVQLNVLTS